MQQASACAANDSKTAELPDVGAPIEVRHHRRARRMTLRVSRTRRAVIVTLPVQCNLEDANTFLNRNIDWVRERLVDLPSPSPFRHGGELPLRGEMHRIVFTLKRGRNVGDGGVVALTTGAGGPQIHVGGASEHAPRRLRDWLSELAWRDLDACVDAHGRNLGLRPKRIVIRDQSSRWGSCSTTGVLSFSWRLIMAPPMVLDYVAAHEVAHLAEMNHGPRFWALVAKTMPNVNEAKSWLGRYGMELHRYGAVER